jgi:hypothetical protein
MSQAESAFLSGSHNRRRGNLAKGDALLLQRCEKTMTKKKAKAPQGLVDPTKLKPFTKKAEESTTGTTEAGDKLLQVIIETPKGCRNKYSFDAEQKIFVLKAALPSGMAFPYDFGFVPQTLAGDGDPLDVLVLMDEPAFPGWRADRSEDGPGAQRQAGCRGRNDPHVCQV